MPLPNAAPAEVVRDLLARISSLGLDAHDVFARAGVSRATGYRILSGTASLGSVRRVNAWLASQAVQS